MVQIIDEDQHFTKDLTPRLTQWGLADKGFKYNLVAVFGSQSTGKSQSPCSPPHRTATHAARQALC